MASIAVFVDIDNTILKGTTIKMLANYFLFKRKITVMFFMRLLYWYVQYKRNRLHDFTKVLSHALIQTESWDLTTTNVMIRECFEETMLPNMYVGVEKRLREHHEKGHRVFFVSSTILPVSELFIEYFGFGESVVTEPEVKDDFYTGEIIGQVCYGIEKKARVKTLVEKYDIDLEKSYAYSDHISDIPMLKMVGSPVVVNPGKSLRKVARQNGWKVLRVKEVRKNVHKK